MSGIARKPRTVRGAIRRGYQIQNVVRDKIKDQGYRVETPHRSKWQPQDFFNLWDIIAIRPLGQEDLKPDLRFIQVSTRRLSAKGPDWQKAARTFPEFPWSSKEYWWWDGEDFVITYLNTGTQT